MHDLPLQSSDLRWTHWAAVMEAQGLRKSISLQISDDTCADSKDMAVCERRATRRIPGELSPVSPPIVTVAVFLVKLIEVI